MSTTTKKDFAIFKNGKQDTSHWFVKLSHKGRRHSFDLLTHVKADALKKAREIYLKLHATGWDNTLINSGKTGGPPVKVGQYCERFTKTFTRGKQTTAAAYCGVLRRVAADIAGIPVTGRRFNEPGFKQTAKKIDNLDLSIFTRESIEAWRKAFVEKAAKDPLSQRTAKISANSYIRHLKAIFNDERRELLGLAIENPAAKIKLYPKADMRFQGSVDPVELFKDGLNELADKPELLKALCLMLCAGLRKNECDKLLWGQIDFERRQVKIETTKFMEVKTEGSIASVDLEPEVVGLFRGWRAQSPNDEFVLKSDQEVRFNLTRRVYRAAPTFRALMAWLETKGVTARKPLHTMRKMFGSRINDQFGIHAASQALRHTELAVTSQHYVSRRANVTVGLGAIIAQQGKVVAFDRDTQQKPPLVEETEKIAQKALDQKAG